MAKANAKVDINGTYDFTHVSGQNTASIFVNFELPIFNRNQGEIARTGYALTQAQEQQQSASDTVLSDVSNAYEAVRSNDEVVQLYTSGYLKQAQDSRDISEYAYKRGAASLLDFLGRRAQLPVGAVSLSSGIGLLYDRIGAVEGSGRNEEPAMRVRTTTVRTHRWQGLSALALVSTIMLVLAGCEGSGSNAAANASSAKNSNNPELFTIPQDQMSHVQVLTVQPTKLTRSLRLTGAVAYNSFRTTPVITQVSGPVSRVVVVPGQKVHQGEPMLYVASPDYSQLRTNYLKAKDAYALAQKAYARARICTSTTRLPNRMWSRRSRLKCRRAAIW